MAADPLGHRFRNARPHHRPHPRSPKIVQQDTSIPRPPSGAPPCLVELLYALALEGPLAGVDEDVGTDRPEGLGDLAPVLGQPAGRLGAQVGRPRLAVLAVGAV